MSFFGTTRTARRRLAGAYTLGRWVEGAYESFTFKGSVQPLTGKALDALPEGRRERASYVVYTATPLKSVEADTNPDEVYVFGAWHEVFRVEPWQNGILPHYKAIIQKLNDPSPNNPAT